MAGSALKEILDRDMSRVEARGVIELASPLLEDLVNHATNTLQRCIESTTGAETDDIAPFMIHLVIVEMVDGIQVLVQQACAAPCIPLLRTAFEALLGLEYIIQADTHYVERSLAWTVAGSMDDVRRLERFDVTTTAGQAFADAVQRDRAIRGFAFSSHEIAEAQKQADSLRSFLQRPQCAAVMQEYANLSKGSRRPNWYSLFGGPKNMRELAEHLERDAQYQVLYDHWSAVGHARDFRTKLLRMANRDISVRPLRNHKDLRTVAGFAATFMIAATRRLLQKYRPAEDIRPWYTTEIRPRHHALWQMSVAGEDVI